MKTLLLLLTLLLWHSLACAEVYEWVDEKGQKHFQDHPRASQEGGISISDDQNDKAATHKQDMQKTNKLIQDMEKARKQREKAQHKALAQQRKHDEKCFKLKSQARKLEARMQKHYREFSNDRSPAYQRQQVELTDRKKYLEQYCD